MDQHDQVVIELLAVLFTLGLCPEVQSYNFSLHFLDFTVRSKTFVSYLLIVLLVIQGKIGSGLLLGPI